MQRRDDAASLDGNVMAEEVVSAPVVSSPAPEAAVVSSVPEAAVSTPVETVVEPVAPVVETPAEKAPEAPVEAKPLLDPTEKPVESKVEEAPVEVKPIEAPLPVYEFKLPEGADAENPQFKAFTSKLGEFQNLSKTEQAAVQKFGQEMIDMHVADVKAIVENQNKSAWDWFKNRNSEWLETSKKDPVIGGEAFKETVSSAAQAISLYGGTKAQQIETAKLLQETGVENHPALLRFLSNITKVAAKEGTPVSTQNAPIQKPGIAQTMYGGTAK